MAFEKIAVLIDKLQKIKNDFGNTHVFYTDLCWGGCALNKQNEKSNQEAREIKNQVETDNGMKGE